MRITKRQWMEIGLGLREIEDEFQDFKNDNLVDLPSEELKGINQIEQGFRDLKSSLDRYLFIEYPEIADDTIIY